MSRGSPQIPNAPYRLWPVKIDSEHRVRLPLTEVASVVTWIKPEPGPIECVVTVGSIGGIQIEPLASFDQQGHAFISALGNLPIRASEAGEDWMDAARLLATAWRLQVNVESTRISFTLPEPIRRSQLVPGARGAVVVFALGEVLEVWDSPKWYEHVRALAKAKLDVASKAVTDLADR